MKILRWFLTTCGSVVAAALGYIGIILIFFSPMISPFGDIDSVDFTEAQKTAATLQMLLIFLIGLIVVAVAISIVVFQKRMIRWFLRRLVEQRTQPCVTPDADNRQNNIV